MVRYCPDWQHSLLGSLIIHQLRYYCLCLDHQWSGHWGMVTFNPEANHTLSLVQRLLVLLQQAVAWLRCYHAMHERVPKRWALSYHCLTKPFDRKLMSLAWVASILSLLKILISFLNSLVLNFNMGRKNLIDLILKVNICELYNRLLHVKIV